ncbi:GTPase ObgE [Lignipirellula cremea]|uniref:GTPase Obg n=1 Tax=Lignipirellula cremea TaxID=2528010 RepID=A0A518DPN8_9BACT|nr:GTPase ObgE [Lignipirellula cremea]QDU93794.1 GTPase Obg [Lignipirellula cremea]
MFVDRVQIEVIAGDGGNGCMSFRREKYVPRGGPDGGDGGEGGSIIIEAVEGVDSLSNVAHRKMWKADKGSAGSGSNRHGRSAQDFVIQVPPGTVIRDANEGFTLKDLKEAGEQLIAARGGRGGKGNTHFKTSTNRAPREWTPGGDGERRMLVLELKVIADVGLVGKPNAGKSTLLSRVSKARPEIADYPFTTKTPNLGRVDLDARRSFIMADIPGLIEGASQGVGLGHEFLRHIERAGILVHLVEPMPADETDPIENYDTIRNEVLQYNANMGQRPEIIVVTKSELPGADEVRQQLAEHLGREVHLISAVTGAGLAQLVRLIESTLQAEKDRAPVE